MEYSQQEQKEYDDFMYKFGLKVGEFHRDFDNLSPVNQDRVRTSVFDYLKKSGQLYALQCLCQLVNSGSDF